MCPPRTAGMGVLCPKPRRLDQLPGARFELSDALTSPAAFDADDEEEPFDFRTSAELLHVTLTECGESGHIDSSPPFFCGSPPCRPSNPMVDDPRFGEQETLVVPLSLSGFTFSPSVSGRKGSSIHGKFGFKPAAVRIEGFDCLNRSRCQGSSITAVS